MSSATANEFQAIARDCLKMAEEAQAREFRDRLLDIARQWAQAAIQIENEPPADAKSRRPLGGAASQDSLGSDHQSTLRPTGLA